MKRILLIAGLFLASCHPVQAATMPLYGTYELQAGSVINDPSGNPLTADELTANELAAINGATSPSASNVLATMNDVNSGGGTLPIEHIAITTDPYTATTCDGDWYDVEAASTITFDPITSLSPTKCCFTTRTTGEVNIFPASVDGIYELTTTAGTDGDGFTTTTAGSTLCFAGYDADGLGLVPGILPDEWSAASPTTCILADQNELLEGASGWAVGDSTTNYSIGTTIAKTGGYVDVCSIDFNPKTITGTLSGYYYVEVWSKSGANLVAKIADVGSIDATTIVAGAWNTITVPDVDLPEGSFLKFTFNAVDAANYLAMDISVSNTVANWTSVTRHDISGVFQTEVTTHDFAMRIRTQQ